MCNEVVVSAGSTAQLTAFEQYVVPEIDVMHRVAMSITRDPVEAEDLVQDTLLRAYKGICSFDGQFPRAWLLTILRNTHASRHRRRRPELMRDPEATMETMAAVADENDQPEAIVVDATFDAALVEALDALPEPFRQVVELVDVDELSYQEAADVLGVPIGTIMSRLHRARHRLRDRLTAAGVSPLGVRAIEPEGIAS